MDQIVVDDSFTKQLPVAIMPCIILDAAGKRLGYFTPEIDPAWYRGLEASVSEEELGRRERAGGGRSLAAILDDLGQRQ